MQEKKKYRGNGEESGEERGHEGDCGGERWHWKELENAWWTLANGWTVNAPVDASDEVASLLPLAVIYIPSCDVYTKHKHTCGR
jgi:hypothetical protein